ncbi:flagellar basal body-associated FliL family protein [Yoonia sp. 2307UL14-13]|uniref:flagellar basal body-associated FliL family protein n=1 Tax=Yoonia sp. 2307UL14-13 TaxID=3126506 RepID=UPI0030AC9C80
MSAEADVAETQPKKGGKGPLLFGVILAVVGGVGGFYAVQSGMLDHGDKEAEASEKADPPKTDFAFVVIDPLVISLPSANGRDHLRFAAQLEVAPQYSAEVEAIKPRIIDVLNGYLRAVELAELEDPSTLIRMRSQMLRRVQVVAGEGRIRDLLIMEFVLS